MTEFKVGETTVVYTALLRNKSRADIKVLNSFFDRIEGYRRTVVFPLLLSDYFLVADTVHLEEIVAWGYINLFHIRGIKDLFPENQAVTCHLI